MVLNVSTTFDILFIVIRLITKTVISKMDKYAVHLKLAINRSHSDLNVIAHVFRGYNLYSLEKPISHLF